MNGDKNKTWDVFLRDQDTDRNGVFDEPSGALTVRVSAGLDGSEADSRSDMAAISADGQSLAFTSFASNLVPGDTNVTWDVLKKNICYNE